MVALLARTSPPGTAIPDDEPCPAEATTRLWQDALADDGPLRMLIAADESDAPIGFVVYVTHGYARSPRSVCYLIELYVDPSRRGAGLGSAMLEKLREIGRDAGWLKIYWMTQADNFAARISKLAGDDPAAAVETGWKLALGRTPTATERQTALDFLQRNGLPRLCHLIFNMSEFIYVD